MKADEPISIPRHVQFDQDADIPWQATMNSGVGSV